MKPNASKKRTPLSARSLTELAVAGILDKKGAEITRLDLTNLTESAATDFFVICEGSSPPHVKAIAENIIMQIKRNAGEIPSNVEGMAGGEWVLIDYVDVMVHVFKKEKRDFYKIEELWADAAAITTYLPDGSSDHTSGKNGSFAKA